LITAPCRKLSIHPSPAATNDAAENTEHMSSFSDLGLSELIADNCHNLGIRTPRGVQQHCIPKVLEGRHVIGIDESGSGKSTAFALSILQRLAENPFAAFALVLTPTRDFAFELMNQFFALGHPFRLRVAAIVGGFDIRSQAKHLLTRPHIVIATPGRINVLLQNNPQIADMFAATKVMNDRRVK
jgi:ATP-dependent RNA helicase DDX49/DBP8